LNSKPTEPIAVAERAVKYVQANLGLWGITNPEIVVIEGDNQYPNRSEEIIMYSL
jgi:FMN-dependent NADH-azoreductase